VLDLHVVADRVLDAVAFDETRHERSAAVGVAEVETGARVADHVVADDPVPGRCLGRDGVEGLVGIEAGDFEVLERHVVGELARALGHDAVTAFAFAVDREMAQGDVADIDEADGDLPLPAEEQGGAVVLRAGDGDRPLRSPPEILQRQTLAIDAWGKLQGLARLEALDGPGGSCPDPRCARGPPLPGRRAAARGGRPGRCWLCGSACGCGGWGWLWESAFVGNDTRNTVRPELVEGRWLRRGFDRLSPNGVGLGGGVLRQAQDERGGGAQVLRRPGARVPAPGRALPTAVSCRP
jgi:hypothetical protein